MTLLDAYAVIAYLQADPHAGPATRRVMDAPGSALAITSVNAAEVVDHRARVRGIEPDEAATDLVELPLHVIAVDRRMGLHAGRLRARHYHRRDCKVSLADCVAAAAVLLDPDLDQLCSADPDLLDVVHAEGAGTLPLPASDGSIWAPPEAN